MTTPPEMRDLALRLLAYEAGEAKTSATQGSAAYCVYEKLRRSLGAFAGVAGFHSLASRAMALAKSEAPCLSAARVTPDGAVQGLDPGICKSETQSGMEEDRAGAFSAGDGGTILIAYLLGLLLNLLGEALTFSLLRNAWPSEAFDDRTSGNGRKA